MIHISKRSLLTLLLLIPLSAHAAENNVQYSATLDIPPVTIAHAADTNLPDNQTHGALRLTPDKSEIITLGSPAGSIIVGNPNHMNIIADSAQRLVIVPRAPGASHFTVLDNDGNVIMQRHVIVAAPTQDYIRIRRACTDPDTCQDTSIFYCPDACHEIGLEQDGNASSNNDQNNGNQSSSSNQTDAIDPNDDPTEGM